MEPDIDCLNYLTQNSFLRNFSFDRFLERYQNQIPLQSFVCYTTGIADGKRIVNAFRILFQCSNSKIKSYYIQWWNTAAFETYTLNSFFKYICFWVHSGMTLRKNFFLYDDRMSLFRSTFIQDARTGYYYRLSALNHFLDIPEKTNFRQQIFSQPAKFYYFQKLRKVEMTDARLPVEKEIKKMLEKILQKKMLVAYLKKSSPELFDQIQNFVK